MIGIIALMKHNFDYCFCTKILSMIDDKTNHNNTQIQKTEQ